MDRLTPVVANRFKNRLAVSEATLVAVETVMAGIALLIAQPVITSNPFYNETEIKKFLTMRRAFHDQFTTACATLARDFEDGTFGAAVQMAAQPLERISKMPASQSRQALVQTVRILRGLKRLRSSDLDPLVMRLIRQAVDIRTDEPEEVDPYTAKYGDRGSDYTDFFRDVLRLTVLPTPMKTILRKVVQLGKGSGKSITLKPHEEDNPGAWFEMSPEDQDKIRKALQEANAVFSDESILALPPEERQVHYDQAVQTIRKIERTVGVHLGIVKADRAKPETPIEEVLKKEAKLEVDGATAFALDQISKKVLESARGMRERSMPPKRKPRKEPDPWERRPEPKPVPLTREALKVVNQLRKAKTFETVERIVREAEEQRILPGSMLETVQNISKEVGKNKAVRDGVPLMPLHFKPVSVEEFQSQHNTGDVEFLDKMSEDEQKELLGRVSRAVSDLEMVFGKGFCGKHRKKLAFRFGGKSGFMAKAHYFAWDNKNVWQPRVTFGEDYEGVLAHELSHYFEDLMAAKLDDKMAEITGTKPKYYIEGGPGDIFGRASAEYFAESYVQGTYDKRKDALHEILPEAFELMAAVVNTPDYARWEDKLTNAHIDAMGAAVKNLTGMDSWELPKDHPYAKAKDAGWEEGALFKSDFPPELVKEAERVYTAMMDGDNRKLSYYQSAGEVWARMCEQYVYMKLSKSGIANPWLTWMHYETDVYVDEKRFEREIAPIFDRLFAKLGARNILARIIRRYKAAASK